jgi:hypothetical protein
MTWTNADHSAQIDRLYFGHYRLIWWHDGPQRTGEMSVRTDASLVDAERFAKHHGIQSFLDDSR